MTKYFFCSGRTALYYGLKSLNLKKTDKVLIPEIICKEALLPFSKLNIGFKFYELKNDLMPNWKNINEINNKNVKAIMILHYFGFPNDINKFLNFKKLNNKIIIEDYCHGLGGFYKNKELGKIGDISITSPRKILKIPNGGVLRINNKKIKIIKEIKNISREKISIFKFLVFKIKSNFFVIKLKRIFFNIFKFNFQNNSVKPKLVKKLVDKYSYKIIEENKFDYYRRYMKYLYIYKLLLKNQYEVIFKPNKKIIPWNVPFYVNPKKDYKKLSNFQKKNNFNIIQWPSFSSKMKKSTKKKLREKPINCVIID
jgi:hypothetical protein